jgi:hypothetical protein
MLADDLRKAIFTNLNLVKELLLTHGDLKVISFVSEKINATPCDVAKFKEVNVNNASTKLKKLFEQGYLTRSESKSSSGGIEFIYSVAHVIKPKLNKPCPICENEECLPREDWCGSCCTDFYENVQG